MKTTNNNTLLARFNNEPALLSETHGGWFQSAVEQAQTVLAQVAENETAEMASDFWGNGSDEDRWINRLRPYVVKDRILQIPVKGVLLNDFPYAYGSYVTGYEYIWEAVKRGLGDTAVDGIALVIDSPGGMVAGNFDLVDRIYERRGEKPIHAFVSEAAYSAAYSIASVADQITMTRSAGVGSIGVVVIQTEYSKMMESKGITVNIIRSKPAKMEGNPYEALSPAAAKRIQKRVDTLHDEFVALVARNRGVSNAEVDATDALTFTAQEAIARKLADNIGAFDDALSAFAANPTQQDNEGDEEMADKAPVFTMTQADHEAALASAVAAATITATAQGATNERTRVQAIIGSDEAKARPKAALAAALKSNMSADDAKGFLSDLPEEAAASTPAAPTGAATGAGAPKGMLNAAMDNTPNPQVGADGGTENPAPVAQVDKVRALLKEVSLPGFKNK
jgi:signal peptide peptidase SppA